MHPGHGQNSWPRGLRCSDRGPPSGPHLTPHGDQASALRLLHHQALQVLHEAGAGAHGICKQQQLQQRLRRGHGGAARREGTAVEGAGDSRGKDASHALSVQCTQFTPRFGPWGWQCRGQRPGDDDETLDRLGEECTATHLSASQASTTARPTGGPSMRTVLTSMLPASAGRPRTTEDTMLSTALGQGSGAPPSPSSMLKSQFAMRLRMGIVRSRERAFGLVPGFGCALSELSYGHTHYIKVVAFLLPSALMCMPHTASPLCPLTAVATSRYNRRYLKPSQLIHTLLPLPLALPTARQAPAHRNPRATRPSCTAGIPFAGYKAICYCFSHSILSIMHSTLAGARVTSTTMSMPASPRSTRSPRGARLPMR